MKKRIIVALIICAMACMFCSAAAAAGATGGIYGAESAVSGVRIVPEKTASTMVINGITVSDFYAGAEKVTVSVNGAVSGAQYLILVLSKDTKAPAEADICYIDQTAAVSGSVSFTAYPPQMCRGEYYVYISSSSSTGIGANGLQKIGSFKYYQPARLGDVDGNGKIEAYDASLILQYCAGSDSDRASIIPETMRNVADTDGNGKIEAYDASLILQYCVADDADKPGIIP